ncbi:MAG: RHS repeat protein, partial [Actinobacteria bacterium]|nr:RHS repeat protein [Actinomycetota bacterium]
MPISISRSGGLNKTRLVYELVGGKRRLHMVIGPTAPGVPACNESNYASDVGCHTIVLNYKPANECPGTAPASVGERLCSISYFAANSETTMNAWSVARYEYDTSGRLLAEWNPQAGELKETYSYAAGGQLASITPPGQKPWTMQYGTVAGEEPDGRLLSVGRASLLASPSEAQWTIAYGVPTSGGGAPYAMSPAEVAKWGQKDLPLDATALFPPTEVPSSPPTSYKQATVYYMDAEGHLDNTATAAGAGTSSPSITTSETDEFGNVIRELSAKNRITALAAGAGSVAKSEELETRRVYEAGTKLVQERGPAHQIRLKGGTTTAARLERVVKYSTETPPAGQAPYVLPIKETTGALPTGGAELLEPRVTETKYNMALRAPEESIVDPEGLNIRTVTRYDKETGLPIETSQPSNAAGGGAGSTKTLYYSAVPGTPGPGCQNLQFAGLPCQITPAAQASGSGRPELTATHFVSYNPLGEPTDVRQSPGGKEEVVRQTISTYDGAGRQTSTKIWGGGSATSKTATDYSGSNGVPIDQRLVCESGCAGFDSQETKVTYDELGRVAKYEDADGAVTETKYDAYGRPTSVTDPRGTQTFHYDETSGLLTSTEVSGVGTFTAGYDADGNLVERGLPNGLTAKTTYNQADEATGLAYTKTSSCGESCTWYEESLERSIEGNILNGTSSLVSDRYAYDKAGRLTEAQETPAGGECTTRAYTYDADSNRLTKTTRNPGVGGACATSGGTTQSYGYDDADRLIGPTYDAWGRITNLSAEFAGGKALTTGYFANNMVATQSQNGVTNTFQLDATGRQRQREQTGGVSGVEIFHYDGQSGSVAWTQLGSTWARNVTGIGGELAAIQESSGTTTFKLTDLHGDVVASASSSPTATALLATYRFDEFGEPESGGAERFGWLGGRARRT